MITKNELLKYSKDYYRKKGSGRPTKKDRRDIEDFTEDSTDDI
jgi:ribosome-associated heat shock protein Hsp15